MTQSKLMIALACCLAAGFLAATELTAQKVVISINPDDPPVDHQKPVFQGVRPAADMAILLDTSNSMDGLINQAKSQLWSIVQRFAQAQKAGKTPLLRVAVFEYGNTNLPASEGYIRQVVGLTDDLDKVSAALFGLTTRGGDEYCGMVIHEAVDRLDWSQEPNAYRVIFIAGNEPFTQGPVNYVDSCRKAIGKGIVVNTIHCGNYKAGIDGKWQHGAQLAEGEYLNIDQDRAVVHIKTPHDKILIELNDQLNNTYMWFGHTETRLGLAQNQLAQDANASSLSGRAFSERAAAKAAPIYSNVGRDLVDTLAADGRVLESLTDDELPDGLRKIPKDQRVAYIQKMAASRQDIQRQIAEVNQQRLHYIEEETKKQTRNVGGGQTLEDAVLSVVTKQMESSGFEFK